MRAGIFRVVGQRDAALLDGLVETLQLAVAVAHAEIRQTAQVFPDIANGGAGLVSMADEESQHPVIQLAGELAVEVTQPEILLVRLLGLFELAAEMQTLGQPEMT